MTGIRKLASYVSVLLLVCCAVAPADAACNLVPGNPPGGPGSKSVAPKPPDGLPYRGRYGRISQAVFAAGVTEFLEVGHDPLCKSVTLAELFGRSARARASIDPGALLALLLYRGDDGKIAHAHVVGSQDHCERVRATQGSGQPTVSCTAAAEALTVTDDGRVRIAYPPALRRQASSLRGAVSIVVVRASGTTRAERPSTVKLDDLLRRLTDASDSAVPPCAKLAPTGAAFRDAGGFVCIDELYRDPAGEPCDANSMALARLTLEYSDFCLSEVWELGQPADFDKQCSPRGGWDRWAGSGCRDEATQLPYVATEGGCLLFPFDFTNIRRHASSNERRLGGTSAFKRADDINAPIRLPGDEFVGSVPIDPKSPSRNPAKPEILVHADSNDVALRLEDNVVDQDDSVLILAPRIRVEVRCEDGKTACECFRTEGDTVARGCWDGTRCTVLEDSKCKAGEPAGYFQCRGTEDEYADEGLPCTHNGHCGTGGKCEPAVCVPRHAVWTSGWERPATDGCTSDESCTRYGDFQCGLSLFHYPQGSHQLVANVDSSENTATGSCKAQRNTRRCSKAKKNCGVTDECVGYILEADKVPGK